MQLSVIIVSHEHGDQLTDTISSLIANYQAYPCFCLRLLLNIPENDKTENFLKTISLPSETYRNPHPCGLSANLNLLLRKITTPFFLILNPDTILPADNIKICCTELIETKAALLTCPSFSMQNEELPNIRHYPSPLSIFSERLFFRKKRLHDFRKILHGKSNQPFWFQGSYLMGVTEIARATEFDEKFYLYFEDVDFCRRLSEAGHKLHVCRNSSFRHHFNRQSSKPGTSHFLQHLKSACHYFRKFNS